MKSRAGDVLAIAMFVSFIIPIAAFAQDDDLEPLWTVITIDIHHDMTQEFEQLQKELNAAYKEAGVTTRMIFQVIRGPSSQYYISTPANTYAEFESDNVMAKAMGEAGAAQWVARVTKCVKNRTVETWMSRPDLSIPVAEGREPRLMVLRSYNNGPGKYGEYNTWLSEKWLPAVKKAGMNGVFFFRNRFGGSQRTWYEATWVDSWAGFDSPHPVRQDLGDEGYAALRSGVGAILEAPVRKLLTLRTDLSILEE